MKVLNTTGAVVSVAVLIFGFGGSATALAAGPAGVNLLSAGNFVILSESGITDIPASVITGNIGTSPITGASITGLGCPEVTGTIYTVDATGPACRTINPSLLTTAVNDMMTAYTDAAGRATPLATELGAGNIGGMSLAPGLYKWSTNVNIPTSVTLSGGANDVWIFQIAGNLNVSSGVQVILSGGAQASNVFWQVGGVTGATLGTTSVFNGNILSAKQIIIQTGATLNGRALAQTQVTLDHSTVSLPGVAPAVVSAPVVTNNTTTTTNSPTVSPTPTTPTTSVTNTTTTTTNTAVVPVVTPSLPNTGFPPRENSSPWNIISLAGVIVVLSASYLVLKKRTI